MSDQTAKQAIVVRGTELLPTDTHQGYREKIARITLDSMVQFVGLLDAKGTVLEINKVALDAVGINLADVEGKPFWHTFWWQVSEEINATLRESIARAAQGEFVRWDTPIYGRAAGKETIIIDASLTPVRNDNGDVVFIAAEGRDITEKKAQEREIADKNIELQGLLERIRELDEIKTQFFANVSHELRTPLALILGPAQRLIDDEGTMGLTPRRETGQVIARNARILLKHVNDLLDMSKLEAGKLKIDLQEIDLASLVRFLASHFAVLAADRNVQYVVDADEVCWAAVDADKLQRILMNLLGNAFKFVDEGGRIRCSLRKSSNEIAVAVDDSGPGVEPELREAIFERFRQGDGGIDRNVAGTGLGLAIAKEFVEMHKGRIEVMDSDLGGARFEVTIPLQHIAVDCDTERPAASLDVSVDRSAIDAVIEELRAPESDRKLPPLEDSPGPPVAGKPRVLVVEDNPDMNRFVMQSLGRYYEVVSAFDGREALDKAVQIRPALVVSDIMMPNMSGVEMIAEMRRLPELRMMPILLLSAKADEELLVKLLEDGAQDFIVKPFSERELIVRVKNLVLAEQARQQIEGLRHAAESANRAKDEFMAMLGHELRNPLSPIMTALHLMKLQGPEGSERARTVIERQVNHLIRLVDDLLDVSRIARGKVELKKEVMEIAELVAKGIEMMSPLLEQQGHTLTVDVPRRGLLIDVDPMRLGQVISNLLSNAAKYTPPAGRIIVRAQQIDGNVMLSVRDNGMGITPEVLPHVFDLFVQERQAIDRSVGGLGLGLTIVRNLIEGHGGSVTARSDGPGRGSEFVVYLPTVTRVQEVAESDIAAASIAAIGEGGAPARRVLVVDDNADAADVLTLLLGLKGYDTRVAHDAPTALRVAEEFMPDIAVVDIGLPVMDGYELASHLRDIPGLSNVRLFALTGYGQESDRQRSREAGFHHHLVKPVDVDVLEAAMNASTPQYQNREQ